MPEGKIVLETRDVGGLKGLTAAVVNDLFCTHDGDCDEAFCLISPPTWAWYVGIGGFDYRFTLGAVLRRLGVWAACFDHPLLKSDEISADDAVDLYGWDRAALDDALAGDVED
ncbi:hypothetical protein [Aeromicrobium sp. 9AM]|uniref:hypothetical protein n=1 Tax=Aeromicrobium sp. 9AM TaxID=2653126 RepID=UPI0013571016|nr:hypothetical protein [Aeromicrobium sp. 9AM]